MKRNSRCKLPNTFQARESRMAIAVDIMSSCLMLWSLISFAASLYCVNQFNIKSYNHFMSLDNFLILTSFD